MARLYVAILSSPRHAHIGELNALKIAIDEDRSAQGKGNCIGRIVRAAENIIWIDYENECVEWVCGNFKKKPHF